MSFPKDLKYSKDHTWVLEEKETITLGVIQDSIEKAGDIVFVNLPKEGEKLKIGSAYLSIESVKASVELKSPVSGEVIEVNGEVFDDPELLNKDSFKNWIVKVKIEDKEELLDFKQAEKHYGG